MELQLVWRRRPRGTIYIRRAPYTILLPTRAQRMVQGLFAEAARLARGRTGLAPNGLPWAAYYVQLLLRGYRTAYRREREPLWLREYRRAARLRAVIASIVAEQRHEPTAAGTRRRG